MGELWWVVVKLGGGMVSGQPTIPYPPCHHSAPHSLPPLPLSPPRTPYTLQQLPPSGTCCSDQTKPPSTASPEDDCQPIDVSNDPYFRFNNRTCLPFVRSEESQLTGSTGHREQTNAATHYLDGSGFYGSSNVEVNKRRALRGGEVLVKKPHVEESTKCGEGSPSLVTPALGAMHQLWLRIHNNLARQLSVLNPEWNDDTLFQEARRLVVAMIQHVTYAEYLPLVLGRYARRLRLSPLNSGYSSTYSPGIDATVANVFGTAAFR
ncbi:putative chorion peroxidase-like [Penaeus vannamei]|uniref:Putative chorion peroxidase-like n=1 Tax=Penaeus vannamei TaxID=6689 RepID=A0A423TTC5_PENVA|nr:putative chorion peroxidase-like [Penaeus vannamei]